MPQVLVQPYVTQRRARVAASGFWLAAIRQLHCAARAVAHAH